MIPTGGIAPYKDGHFLYMSSQEVYAAIVTNSAPSLAQLSTYQGTELVRIGFVEHLSARESIYGLYTLTSAGVWVANTDAYGRKKVNNDGTYFQRVEMAPRIMGAPVVDALEPTYVQRRIGTAGRTFTSNAAGGFDLDVNLASAIAGYYTVIRFGKIRASQNVAAGVLVIHDSAGNLVSTLGMAALVAYTPSNTLEGVTVFIPALTDNRGLVLDTTSHDLGNATSFVLDYEYWYET